VLVELDLGDPDGLLEVLVGSCGLTTSWPCSFRNVGLTPPGTDCQPWRKRIVMPALYIL